MIINSDVEKKEQEYFWKNRRVLITGANGFLASWVTKELLGYGAHIVSLVFAKNPLSIFEQERLDKTTETIYGDVLDFALLKRMIETYKIQTVFHLGAQPICAAAEADPLTTLDINIKGTYHVLEAVRQVSPTTHVLVASSDKAYGIHEQLPYEEHYPLHGEYPYEVSKTCADLVSMMYWHTYKIPVCVVRCGNFYGGGDAHFSRLIPNTIKCAYYNNPPLLIRNDLRDYLYVEDAARGYVLLAEKMARGAVLGEAFNFGTEQPRTVVDVMETILRLMGKPHLRPQISDKPRLGIPSQYLSYKKAKQFLGWEPLVSFEDGLQKTIAWYSDYFNKGVPASLPVFSIHHQDLV